MRKNKPKHRNWISRMHLPMASAALVLAAVLVPAVITTQSAQAQSLLAPVFKKLVNLAGSNGANPYNMSLVQGRDGNLYGTTFAGGANSLGTVFKLTPIGKLTTLHSFAGPPSDGAYPEAGLVLGSNGIFYGTTVSGGANGFGAVFSMSQEGVVKILYSFCQEVTTGNCDDGNAPEAPLIQATNGTFYGTTSSGGTACIATGCTGGTVFSMTPAGKLTPALFSLDDESGMAPAAALVQASNGDFYGTTYNGQTVFDFTLGGPLNLLYSLDGPVGALVQASNGNFYGTVAGTLPNNGGGGSTVFSFTAGGTPTTLYSFCAQKGCPDGADPYAGVIQATDGNLYGTTDLGGAFTGGGSNGLCLEDAELVDGCGTIFEIGTTGGTLNTLHSFNGKDGFNGTDGSLSLGGNGLVQATNGTFYGTTVSGGTNTEGDMRDGTVFSLSVGLGPFVKTLPTSGKVAAGVMILGTDLTGATSVTFNGTAAAFSVVSSSEITTTVPTGATTGTVQVTTSSGTLSSNVNFRVSP